MTPYSSFIPTTSDTPIKEIITQFLSFLRSRTAEQSDSNSRLFFELDFTKLDREAFHLPESVPGKFPDRPNASPGYLVLKVDVELIRGIALSENGCIGEMS